MLPDEMAARYPPCEDRDGLSCQSCNELAEIETQIEDLYERRRQARVSRNHIHSPLIHQFPFEIVTTIFMLVFPSRDAFPCKHPAEEVSSPLILTQVCHTWRLFALSSPRLWNSISFNAHKPNFPRLDHQIARSGVLPLSIHLHAFSDDLSDRQAKKAMSFIMGQLHRTASLCLTLSGRIFEAVCNVDYPRAAPLLEKLHIHCTDQYSLSRLRLTTEPLRPRHVELDLFLHKQIHLDWTNVSSVTLQSCPMDGFLREILAVKHLKQVILRLSNHNLPKIETILVNRSIEDLTLGTEAATLMLTMISLPLLRKLRVYVDGICNLRLICDFLHRSRCPLQILDLHILNERRLQSTEAVMEVLENTSMLQQLTLQFSTNKGLPPSAFELLIWRLSSQDVWFLPCLQTFSLHTDFVPPINLLLEAMTTDDNVRNGPNTVCPLHDLVLKLEIPFAEVGPIPRDSIRRILQLRAAGQTISVTSSFYREEIDLVEYWKNVYHILLQM